MIFLRWLVYIIVFYISFVLLFPKNEVINYVEKKFLVHMKVDTKIELTNSIEGYKAKNSTVYYKNAPIAVNQSLDINPFLFYNIIKIKNTTLEGMAGSLLPQKIDDILIKYTLLDPMNIHVDAKGQFGTIKGNIDLKTSIFSLDLTPSPLMNTRYQFILRNMKKVGQIYRYEYKI